LYSSQVEDALLLSLQSTLQDHNKTLEHFQLPLPELSNAEVFSGGGREVTATPLQAEQDSHIPAECALRASINEQFLNAEQRSAYNAFCQAVDSSSAQMIEGRGIVMTADSDKHNAFLWQAPAGTGKTFTANLCADYVRGKGFITLCVATSGLAATLMRGGTTAHSRFKIPLDVNQYSVCGINANTKVAELLRRYAPSF
jgi:hypothetical protein